jgi:hypothetical protein
MVVKSAFSRLAREKTEEEEKEGKGGGGGERAEEQPAAQSADISSSQQGNSSQRNSSQRIHTPKDVGHGEAGALAPPKFFLFQTGAKGFYEKLGGAELSADAYPILNSTGKGSDAKRKKGFWDASVMCWPAAASFVAGPGAGGPIPKGEIDLLGPGY